MDDKKILQAVMRNDFYAFAQKAFLEVDNSQAFIPAPYIEIITDALMQCANKEIKRLIINIPPRKLKSFLVSIAFIAWLLGKNPRERIVSISYSQELANKFSRDRKKLMNSEFYKETFATRLNPDKQTENIFETTENGYSYATSIGGSLTGFGGNYIIIDDPIKANEARSEVARNKVKEWYNNTLASRLDNKKDGVIIIVMQRLHTDDLVGLLSKQDGWKIISLPAIAEEDEEYILSNNKKIIRKAGEVLCSDIEPIESLLNLKKTMSSYDFSAQYQQAPIPEKGNIIDFDRFVFYDNLPENGTIYQSWDIAFKTGKRNDYSVCITAMVHEDKIYIMDIYRDKVDIAELEVDIVVQCQRYRCTNIIIEDTNSTKLLVENLNARRIYPMKYPPKLSKEERANYATRPIYFGKVLLKRNAPWLENFRTEIIAFPEGRHDDQVDAFTQLVLTIQQNNTTPSLIRKLDLMLEYEKSEETKLRRHLRFKRLGLDKLF